MSEKSDACELDHDHGEMPTLGETLEMALLTLGQMKRALKEWALENERPVCLVTEPHDCTSEDADTTLGELVEVSGEALAFHYTMLREYENLVRRVASFTPAPTGRVVH